MDQQIIQIVNDVDKIISMGSESKQQKGSYIMGVTMFRDDYEDIILVEPMIEQLAEWASSLEITKNEKYIDLMYYDIVSLVQKIKIKYLSNV